MHHGEERVAGQFVRSKEKNKKKEQTEKLWVMDTDGGRQIGS